MSEPANLTPLQQASDVSPWQLIAVLWRGRWLILGSTLIGLGLGYLNSKDQSRVWDVQSVLQVEPARPTLIGPGFANYAEITGNYRAAQAEILRSIPILQIALGRPDVEASPVFEGVDNRPRWLKSRLSITVGSEDDLITVSLRSEWREEACVVVNAVVDAYDEFHADRKREIAGLRINVLSDERDEQLSIVEKLEQFRVEFLKNNPGLVLYDETAAMLIARTQELTGAILDRLEAEEKWNAAESATTDGLATNGEPTGAALRELELDRIRLLGQLTPDHPNVLNLDRQIAALEAQTARYHTAEFNELEQLYLICKKKEDHLEAEVLRLQSIAMDLGARQSDLDDMETRIERMTGFVDALDLRIKEIDINENPWETDPAIPTVFVLEAASPYTASEVSGISAMLVAVLGLILGCGSALLWGALDQRLRTGRDFSGLEMRLVGSIPKTRIKRRGAIPTWEARAGLAEASRTLRTTMYFGEAGEQGELILITSPDVGDGKSLITSSLAIAMAKAGRRTLIVDANLRAPTQAKLFGVDSEHGLAQVLTGLTSVTEAVFETGLDLLHLLPSGPLPLNPAEILHQRNLGELLLSLRERYDCILVDAAPILPFADARIIAALCTSTLLVVRANSTTREHATSARNCVLAVGGNLVGAVLNRVPKRVDYAHASGSVRNWHEQQSVDSGSVVFADVDNV